jgi:Fe-S cluster assembly protein SufB
MDSSWNGSAILEIPSCLLVGDNSQGEFYSVALTNNYQQADTGTKWLISEKIHVVALSQKVSQLVNLKIVTGAVNVTSKALGARNYSQCDSLLIGNLSNANTFPFYFGSKFHYEDWAWSFDLENWEEQIFTWGICLEKAVELMISGFCREIFTKLPLEFAAEADKLLTLN